MLDAADVGPTLLFVTPNHVTRLAYVLHTAGDVARTNEAIDPLVQREIALFLSLRDRYSDPLSLEGVFLSRVAAIVVGVAGDITRRKRVHLAELAAADREYEVLYDRLTKSSVWAILVRGAMAIGKVVFLGAVGLMISQILAPYVPSFVAHRTGTSAPSALLTFLTVVAGGWVGYKMNEFSRQSIEATRNWTKQASLLKYDAGRLQAFRQSWGELKLAWEQYSGRPYEETAFFELMIADDLRQDTDYYRQLRLHQRSMAVVVIEACRGAAATCAGAVRRRRRMATTSTWSATGGQQR